LLLSACGPTAAVSNEETQQPPEETAAFVRQSPGFHGYMIYDIGVADFNADGNLDIFSSNCFSSPNFMAGDGQGGFRQVRTELGLDHTPAVPGFGAWEKPPAMDKPGLYIYIVDRYWFIEAHDAAGLPALHGSVRLICRENVSEGRDVAFHVTRRLEPSGLVSRTIDFTCLDGGLLRFKPEPHFVDPVVVTLDGAIPLDKVFLGSQKVPAPSHRFNLLSGDPHSMLWADINADGCVDVFIGRGGMRSLRELEPRIAQLKDRLLLGTGGGFKDVIDSSGIHKDGCPIRKACWVDVNGDDLLDLFYIGARGVPSVLFVRKQMTPMAFEEMAQAFGVERLPHAGFCWRDFDQDGHMDLAGLQEGHLALFWGAKPPDQRVTRMDLVETKAAPYQVIASDYNQDGRNDLLFILVDQTLMPFANRGKRVFEPIDPASMGLPSKGLVASWCDYDNDGLQDMLVVPGGLYRQTSPGHFEGTGLLADLFDDLAEPPVHAWISWFDMDNNGTRDLLATARVRATVIDPFPPRPDPYRNRLALMKNTLTQNNWLEVVLTGPEGNGPALGSRVLVEAAGAFQMQEPGDNEGSENSQGHYRLYFGLGRATAADSLLVEWPDGTKKQLRDVAANQILTLRY